MVSRHNRLRDVLLESFRLACLGPQVEAGSGLGHEGHRTRPADILIPHWDLGKPAALDLTVTSTLNSSTLMEAGVTSGSAVLAAEVRKHNANDAKCSELGWSCIPIAVETYGCWGAEAMQTLSHLASRLATSRGNCSKSHATCLLYGRLSLTLMQANARALLWKIHRTYIVILVLSFVMYMTILYYYIIWINGLHSFGNTLVIVM